MTARPSIRFPAWNIPVACAVGALAGFYGIGGPFLTRIPDFFPVFLCLIIPSAFGIVMLDAGRPRSMRCGLFLVVLASFSLFFTLKRIEYDLSLAGTSVGQPVRRVTEFSGVCLDDSMRTSTGRTLVRLRLVEACGGGLRTTASGTVIVLCEGDGQVSFPWGSVCTVGAPLRLPESAGVEYFAFCEEADVSLVGWDDDIFRLRARVRAVLNERIGRMDRGSLLSALFLGDKDGMPPEVYDNFRKSGSVHILALSGMHLGLIAVLLSFALTPFLGRRTAFRLILVVLACYLFIAGPKPSLLRSALMMLFAWIFTELGRNADPVVIPSLAFVIYLLLDPSAGFSLAFQLSFLAVTGIILWSPFLNARLLKYLPRPIAGALSASLSAQAFTAPIVVSAFGTFYPVGIAAGLLLGPLTTLFLWVGISGLAFTAIIPGFDVIPAAVLRFLSDLILSVVSSCASFPALTFR